MDYRGHFMVKTPGQMKGEQRRMPVLLRGNANMGVSPTNSK